MIGVSYELHNGFKENIGSRPLMMAGANIILLDSTNRILLQLRKDNDCWGLPGGSIELGESLEEVSSRELLEETGLIANTLNLFDVFSGKEFYYKYPHGDEVYNVVATYLCNDYHGELTIQENEVKEFAFFAIQDLPEKISPPDLPIIRKYKQMKE